VVGEPLESSGMGHGAWHLEHDRGGTQCRVALKTRLNDITQGIRAPLDVSVAAAAIPAGAATVARSGRSTGHLPLREKKSSDPKTKLQVRFRIHCTTHMSLAVDHSRVSWNSGGVASLLKIIRINSKCSKELQTSLKGLRSGGDRQCCPHRRH
jgi:hypothetical protein